MCADYKEEVPERYRISFNRLQGVFYILDMWHDSVKNLPQGAEIPIDSPAMKILSSLEVNALLGELKNMGWLEKLMGPIDTAGAVIAGKSKTIHEISIENITAIVQSGKDPNVAKDAIMAVREIMNKI